MPAKAKARNPKGLDTKKPIALRLTPKDRADAVLFSARMGMSLSLLAYKAYLAGLKTIINGSKKTAHKSSSCSAPKAEHLSAGAGTSSADVFSS